MSLFRRKIKHLLLERWGEIILEYCSPVHSFRNKIPWLRSVLWIKQRFKHDPLILYKTKGTAATATFRIRTFTFFALTTGAPALFRGGKRVLPNRILHSNQNVSCQTFGVEEWRKHYLRRIWSNPFSTRGDLLTVFSREQAAPEGMEALPAQGATFWRQGATGKSCTRRGLIFI